MKTPPREGAPKIEGNRTHDKRLAASYDEVRVQFAVRF